MTGNDLSGLLAGKALKELDWRALEDSEDLVSDHYLIRAEGKNFPTRHWVWICEFHGQRLEAEPATLDGAKALVDLHRREMIENLSGYQDWGSKERLLSQPYYDENGKEL